MFSVQKYMKFYVQEETSRQTDFLIKATSLNTVYAFSKMCFDEEIV